MTNATRIVSWTAAVALVAAGWVSVSADAGHPESWLGVVLGDPADDGLRVLAVVPGGPADEAGLRDGDLLLAIGGAAIGPGTRVREVVKRFPPGRPVDVRLLRDGAVLEASLVPVQRVDSRYVIVPDVPAAPGAPLLQALDLRGGTAGIRTSRMSAELRSHFGAPEDEGVLVTRVRDDTPGARAGIRVGDVLLRLGETPIRTPSDLLTRILVADDARVLPAIVVREGKTVEFELDLSSGTDEVRPDAVLLERYLEDPRRRENRVKMLEQEIEGLRRRIRDLEEELREVREHR